MSRLVLWALATILLPTQKVYVGPGTSMHWVGAFAADVCPWSSISLAAFLVGLAFAASALCWMSGGHKIYCPVLKVDQIHPNFSIWDSLPDSLHIVKIMQRWKPKVFMSYAACCLQQAVQQIDLQVLEGMAAGAAGILLRLFQILSPRAELVEIGRFHWGKVRARQMKTLL